MIRNVPEEFVSRLAAFTKIFYLFYAYLIPNY